MNTDRPIEVELCMGSACFARGNRGTAAALESFVKENGLSEKVTIRGTMCEGKCRTGPHARVDGEPCRCKAGEIPETVRSLVDKKGT